MKPLLNFFKISLLLLTFILPSDVAAECEILDISLEDVECIGGDFVILSLDL